jgi:son of sevenless
MAAAVYSSQLSTMALASSSVAPQPPNEEQYFSTFFCRALYDYQTENESSLSFRKDDIIEVLTKLDSGWWDGLLGQERGWFPSNYVTVISDQEADAALSAAEDVAPAAATTAQSSPSMNYQTIAVDWSQSLAGGHSAQSHDWEQKLQNEVNLAAYQTAHAQRAAGSAAQSNDFWVPQVSSDGRVRPLHYDESLPLSYSANRRVLDLLHEHSNGSTLPRLASGS